MTVDVLRTNSVSETRKNNSQINEDLDHAYTAWVSMQNETDEEKLKTLDCQLSDGLGRAIRTLNKPTTSHIPIQAKHLSMLLNNLTGTRVDLMRFWETLPTIST